MTDAITAAAAEVIPAAALQVLGGIKVVWEKVSSTVSERLQAAENELGRNARTRGLTAGGGGDERRGTWGGRHRIITISGKCLWCMHAVRDAEH